MTATPTATTVPGTSTPLLPRRRTEAPPPTGARTLLRRWSTARRRRRYEIEKRRNDARDDTEGYLDRTDATHLLRALTAFVQR